MTQTWTVYTVEQMTPDPSNPGFNVVKTRWTEDGPDEGRVVASMTGVDRQAADRHARLLQASYDRTRNRLPMPAAGEKL